MKRSVISFLWGVLPALLLLGCYASLLRKSQTDPVSASPCEQPKPSQPNKTLWELWQEGGNPFNTVQSMNAEEARAAFYRSTTFEPGSIQRTLRRWTFDRWAETAPQEALRSTLLVSDEDIAVMIRPILERWAMDDHDACRNWLARERDRLPEDVVRGKSWEDLEDALDAVAYPRAPSDEEMAQVWDLLDQETKSRNANKDLIWPLIHHSRASGDWKVTLERLTERKLDIPNTGWAVIQHWLQDDFDAATGWVASLSDWETQNQWIDAMAWDRNGDNHEGRFDRVRLWDWIYENYPDKMHGILWMSDDLRAIANWLQRHPDKTPPLEEARGGFAKKLAEHDQEAAIAWASALVDPAKRDRALTGIAYYWMRTEPWAASAWARETLGWSEEEISKRIQDYRY